VSGAVHVHVHQVATGSFPLRVADLLFTDDRLLIPEYAHLTPLFGLARGGMSTVAGEARERYRAEGVSGLLELAERTHSVPYEELQCVRVFESRHTQPKIAVDTASGPPFAYRIHASVDVETLVEALRSLGDRRGFSVESRRGIGFSPANSVRRFLADR
jgi:hypothetical protein